MIREPSGSRRALARSSGDTMPWSVGALHRRSGDEAVTGRRQRVTIDPADRIAGAARLGVRSTAFGSPRPAVGRGTEDSGSDRPPYRDSRGDRAEAASLDPNQ
jgi:hypothetical protein